MTAFSVWKFDTPEGAAHTESLLEDAQRDQLIKIVDHAVVSWPAGSKEPTVKQGHEDRWRGTAWGAFWGLFVGAIMTVAVVGLAAGAGLGVLAKATEKLGISEEQLRSIGEGITEGTSALFLVTENANLDRLGERMRGVHMKLMQTNLTDVEQSLLRESLES